MLQCGNNKSTLHNGVRYFLEKHSYFHHQYFYVIRRSCTYRLAQFQIVRFLLKCRLCKKLLLSKWNSWQLPISFIKIRFSCNQNIGETRTQCKKKCLFNVLITRESNEVTSYKIHTLADNIKRDWLFSLWNLTKL